MKIYVILPAYNEEEGLEKILDRIRKAIDFLGLDYEILIVNDGSKDRTALISNIFEKLDKRISLKSLDQNQGITTVFRTGFKHVLKKVKSKDVIISLDSDNTQSPYAIVDMIEAIRSGADLVIASRFVPNAKVQGVPKYRIFLSNSVATIMGYLFPYPGLKDYSTFFRAYKGSLILNSIKNEDDIDRTIEGHGFSSMAGFLMHLVYNSKPKIKEVPINLRYDLKEGGSGIKIFKTIKGYLILFQKLLKIKNDPRTS